MPFFSWSPAYSVNHPVIDRQHRQLLNIINELHDAMAAGQGKDVLGGIFNRLVDYTETHFVDEERLMVKCSYPGYKAHKQEHQAFSHKVKVLQTQFAFGQLALSIQVMDFLKDWLVNHIQSTDQKYKNFI